MSHERCAKVGVVLAALLLGPALCLAAGASAERPRLDVSAPDVECPAVAGRFVVLLGGDQGMLVLSAAPFAGATRVPAAEGGPVVVTPSGGGRWELARVEAADGGNELWAARYRFLNGKGRGCVAFDRDGFAAAGDLATYVHWLTERVYLRLPDASRLRWPALELDARTVALRVEQEGAGPLDLSGREGGTLAYRTPAGDVVMLQPFILDPASGTVALYASTTPADHEPGTHPKVLGWLVASPAAPASLDQPTATIHVVEVTSSE